MKKISNIMLTSFYFVMSIITIWIVLHIIIHNSRYNYIESELILFILLFGGIVYFIYNFLEKNKVRFAAFQNYIVIGFLLFMFIAQLYFTFKLRYKPSFDLGAIYDGAIEWVKTGNFTSLNEYFAYFPNNIGGLIFLYILFKISSFLGIHDYYAVAAVINSILSILTMYLTYLICKRYVGKSRSFFVLVLYFFSLPFYFIAAVFYTDALSMIYPVLILYLYCKFQEAATLKKSILYSILIGLVAAVGIKIKFTVIIILVAILLDNLLKMRLKHALILVTAVLITCGSAAKITDYYIYHEQIDAGQADELNTPYLHWIMMGLNGDGGYNPSDYELTRSYNGSDEQKEVLLQEIKNRINNLGFYGLIDHTFLKLEKSFGDGTYSLSDFLDDSPAERSWIHELILYDGKYYAEYKTICTAVLISIIILVAFSCIYDSFYLNSENRKYLVPRLTIFGLFLFLAIWETSGRYFSNHLPIIFISATMGIDYFSDQIKLFGNSLKRAYLGKK